MKKLRPEYDRQLSSLNTLALPAVAERFFETHTEAELEFALKHCTDMGDAPMILGGGSNIVLSGRRIPACIHIALQNIQTLSKTSDQVVLAVSAGVNWNEFVEYCLSMGYFGLENLALIPGNVGAAPVQNIGAYGVELDQFIQRVHFRWLDGGEKQSYTAEQCEFAYRDSVFKRALRDKIVITDVEFTLPKRGTVNVEYGALRDELGDVLQPSPMQVRDAVVAIRRRKLPDPSVLPNAGSFFKNPVVSGKKLKQLREHFSDVVFYATSSSDEFKLAAGWLLENAGWRGFEDVNVGVHQEQALVLVNHNNACGDELLALADRIMQSIRTRFGVELEIEPRIY